MSGCEEQEVDDLLLALDGRVVEVVTFPGDGNRRFHVPAMRIEVHGPDRRGPLLVRPAPQRRGGVNADMPGDGAEDVQAFAGRVRAAMAAASAVDVPGPG